MAKAKKSYAKLHSLLDDATQSIVFDKEEGLACYPHLADSFSRLAVVYGENASGKSLFFSVMRAFLGDLDSPRQEIFTVSMRQRTSEGMHRMFMYPRESTSSTGSVSVHAVKGTFHNAAQREHPVWIFLDEPDTGLSDKYASGLGAYLAQEVNNLPKNIRGVVLVSHSRPLLRRLLSGLAAVPHEIAMENDVRLADFVDPEQTPEASIEELLALNEVAHQRFRKVQAILDRKKAKKS